MERFAKISRCLLQIKVSTALQELLYCVLIVTASIAKTILQYVSHVTLQADGTETELCVKTPRCLPRLKELEQAMVQSRHAQWQIATTASQTSPSVCLAILGQDGIWTAKLAKLLPSLQQTKASVHLMVQSKSALKATA